MTKCATHKSRGRDHLKLKINSERARAERAVIIYIHAAPLVRCAKSNKCVSLLGRVTVTAHLASPHTIAKRNLINVYDCEYP